MLNEKPKSHLIQYKDGKWQKSTTERNSGEVFISPDGKKMMLGNKFRDRNDSGWSEEKSLGSLFDSIPIMRLTSSSFGTFVLDEMTEIGTLRYSRVVNGKRETPKAFNKDINTGRLIAHPFIAKDESYLIWDSERKSGYGKADLYISFRKKDGSWGPAINMGKEINDASHNTYGSVTPDGKYFFFNTIDLDKGENGIANIFWVDAKIIETLRLKNKEN